MKKLILIDGSNLMFRAYYATAYAGNLMQNSKGQYTNALYGLANMLNSIIKDDFTHMVIAFDKGKETFRHKTYEAYKAGRKKMPDEFRTQLPLIPVIAEKMGCFVYEHDALEADDIIGTLAHQYYDNFDIIEIISNDKDLYQLLNDKVVMRVSKRGLEPDQIVTEKTLYETYQLTPEQIPDLKGLMGDSSDNIPGIPSVGEKTALKLLHEYQSIEGILSQLNEIKGKLKETLTNHLGDAIKWRKIATIITDFPLDFTLDDFAYKGYEEQALIEFYETLEFHSLIKRLNRVTKVSTQKHFTVIENTAAMTSIFAPNNALILETFNDHYHDAVKLGFGLHNDYGSYFIPYDIAITAQPFLDFLSNQNQTKSTYDYKKLWVCLAQNNLSIAGVDFDLLLAAYVINPSYASDDFKVLVNHFSSIDIPYKETIYGKGKSMKIPEDTVYQAYAVNQAQAVYELKSSSLKQIEDAGQLSLLNNIELPLSEILGTMEHTGIRIDLEALSAFNDRLETEITNLTESIHQAAGTAFNIASPKQLAVILFEKLKLPSYKKSKTGYSTNLEVLTKLKNKHPIIKDVMRYRTLTKLQSTYVNGLQEAVADDGKIHTIYRQAFTQTGRLSSIEPNLQNIPIRTAIGRELRQVFIPEKDHVLLASDYSQIELRVLAHMANEKTLIEAFKTNQDIHATTAKEIFEKETITAQDRRMAKAVNFGIIYGQSAWGLAEQLDISNKDAETFINRYYLKFSDISRFMDSLIEHANRLGYVETMFNRRRYIPEINSRIYAQRELGKRTAMNAPLQGSAADIIKIAMVNIDAAFKKNHFKAKMILQIHDELVFTVPANELQSVKKTVQTIMETACKLNVPLTVSMAEGANLDEAK